MAGGRGLTHTDYPGGMDASTANIQRHLDDGLVREDFSKIAGKFASIERMGPKFVADAEDRLGRRRSPSHPP